MNSSQILEAVIAAIGNAKGLNISVLDVQDLTDIADHMVIVTGTSNRHVKSIMNSVFRALRGAGQKPTGIEGEQHAQWILLDYGDVLVHVMTAETREFYNLERLWKHTLRTSQAENLGTVID